MPACFIKRATRLTLHTSPSSIAAARGANFSQQNSDLFISIGARLDHGQTAYNHINFAREAKKVVVDIDAAEIDKMQFDIDCRVNFDARDFIEEMLLQKSNKYSRVDFSWWLAKCKEWQRKYPVVLPEYWEQETCVNNYVLIDVLSELLQPSDLLIPGSSANCRHSSPSGIRCAEFVALRQVLSSENQESRGDDRTTHIGPEGS